jgi:hypothetical protein
MKIYHIHPESGEYMGSTDARLDPLELEINKKEIYLLPAHATFAEPPDAVEGKMTVMENGEWTQVDIPEPPEPEPIPEPTKEELEVQEVEALIQAKMREQAIAALKVEGKLTTDGKVAVKG